MEERIQKDLMSAMKEKDENRLRAVRSIKTAITEVKTAANGKKVLDDGDVIKIIKKLAKQREEAAEIYRTNGREELVKTELAELAVLCEYLPKMLSEEETERVADEAIAELGASTMKDMGRVMGWNC